MRYGTLSRFAAIFAAALFVVHCEAHATEPGTPVQIDVQIISATTDNKGVDQRLEGLRQRLSEFKYSSYQLLSEQTLSLTMNGHQTVTLPDNYILEITPQSIEPSGMIRMHLHVHGANQKKIVDTEYAIAPGGDLLVGGMKHDGGALMVALHHRGR